MYTYSFEKLEVWNESKELTKSIYTITSTFPDQEKFGLISQLRRAAVSICSDIAEGSARSTYKDMAHFTTMDFISEKIYSNLRIQLESITNKLNALRNYQSKQITKSTNNQINE